MSAEHIDGGPAFPIAVTAGPTGFIFDPRNYGGQGMSMRDWFATHAPAEIPHWFNHDETPLPSILGVHKALELQPGFAELSSEDKATLTEWLRDGSWDLDDRLAPIGEAADKFITGSRLDREQAEQRRKVARYFAWRWHYADAMLRWRGLQEPTK